MTFKCPYSSKWVRKNQGLSESITGGHTAEERGSSHHTQGDGLRGAPQTSAPGTGWRSKNVHLKAMEDTKSKGSVKMSKDRVHFQNFMVNLKNSLGEKKKGVIRSSALAPVVLGGTAGWRAGFRKRWRDRWAVIFYCYKKTELHTGVYKRVFHLLDMDHIPDVLLSAGEAGI